MKVELPGESKSFADIKAGECFAFTREQVTSVCMKVEWLSSASVAVLWSASDDWTVPHLIAPTEIAGSILHSLPSAVRSEEHTSELQSQSNLVCRLLLEKKNRGAEQTSCSVIPTVRPSRSYTPVRDTRFARRHSARRMPSPSRSASLRLIPPLTPSTPTI